MICPECGYRHGSQTTYWNAENALDGISEFDEDDESICEDCYESQSLIGEPENDI